MLKLSPPYSDQLLNLSGTILVGGAVGRSQSTTSTISSTVTGFGVADLESGQTELGKGAYLVVAEILAYIYRMRA